MQRRLVVLALCTGCGNVQDPGPDATQVSDPLTGTLSNGCVLALHMEEAVWTGARDEIKDSCGNDNHGTLTGSGGATVAAGAHGRSGSFSGNSCIDIPDADSLHGTTGLTLSAWIFPTKLNHGSDANGIISKRTSGNNQNEYSLAVWLSDTLYVDLDGETDRFHSTGIMVERSWAQITVVYDGGRALQQRARIFVNGALDITQPETSATLTRYPSTLHIGCMPAPTAPEPTQQNFFGQIDEVVIWNRALSDAEIVQWYMNTRPTG